MEPVAAIFFVLFVLFILNKIFGKSDNGKKGNSLYPDLSSFKSSNQSNSLLRIYNAKHPGAILDKFQSLDEVTKALRSAGLESSNLIFGEQILSVAVYPGEKCYLLAVLNNNLKSMFKNLNRHVLIIFWICLYPSIL